MEHIFSVNIDTPKEVKDGVAARVKLRRLELDLTQEGLAARAGMPVGTYRRFERTGEISLSNLVMLAMALDCLADFKHLFAQKQYTSISEILQAKKKKRKRGKQND